MHIGSRWIILVISFGIDMYMRVRVPKRIIIVPSIGVVLGFVACSKMRNGRRRHHVGFSIHLIGSRHWMAKCINTSTFPAVISGLNTREAWCCVIPVMTPHVRVHVKLSTTVWPGTPKRWKKGQHDEDLCWKISYAWHQCAYLHVCGDCLDDWSVWGR